jgi:WbqC-like protein family
MTKDDSLRSEGRVIAICEAVGAERYVNPIGGTALYHHARLVEHGLELAFFQPEPRHYRQFASVRGPGRSIIDVLMFNDATRLGRCSRSSRWSRGERVLVTAAERPTQVLP